MPTFAKKEPTMKSRSPQQQADRYMELIQKHEPLRPSLKKYVDDPGFGSMIRHPLCVTTCDPNHAALVHEIIDERKQLLDKAIQAKNWEAVLSLHEPPFMLKAFIDYCDPIDDATYWRLVGHVWNMQEIVRPNQDVYLNLFSSPRKERHCLMLEDERRDFESLPKQLPIYRGFFGRGAEGISWTLDCDRAEWFAKRFQVVFPNKRPKVASGIVNTSDVLAYFTARNDREVVVDPRSVKLLGIENLA